MCIRDSGEGIELALGVLAHGADLLALLIERLDQRGIDHGFGSQPLGPQSGAGAQAQDQRQNRRQQQPAQV